MLSKCRQPVTSSKSATGSRNHSCRFSHQLFASKRTAEAERKGAAARSVDAIDQAPAVPPELAWVLDQPHIADQGQSPTAEQQPRRTPMFFMHTPFARRLLGLFLHAKQNRSWHVP